MSTRRSDVMTVRNRLLVNVQRNIKAAYKRYIYGGRTIQRSQLNRQVWNKSKRNPQIAKILVLKIFVRNISFNKCGPESKLISNTSRILFESVSCISQFLVKSSISSIYIYWILAEQNGTEHVPFRETRRNSARNGRDGNSKIMFLRNGTQI